MKTVEDKYFLRFTKLNEFDNLIHFYTKKPFTIGFSADTKEEKDEKFKDLGHKINYNFKKYILALQEHTTNVVKITEENVNDTFTGVDGFITNLKDVALVTTTADCQAILLYDPVKKVIGNIHSGWKGTLNKIIVNAINIMINDYNSNPQDIIACICPSILKCCFEVDEEVVNDFKKNFTNIEEDITLGDIKDNKQKYYIDTISLNKKLLSNLGLKAENIITSDICTRCNYETYHSYRARNITNLDGRNIAVIVLK